MPSLFTKLIHAFSGKGKNTEDSNTANEDISESTNNKSVNSEQPAKSTENKTNEDSVSLSTVRRRLSVDGRDINLDGTEEMFVEDVPDIIPCSSTPVLEESIVNVFAGKSQKGYVPYNPRKVNQDYMLIREDPSTKTLVLGTFDGHGEHGHCISEFICTNFYNHLVQHDDFATDVKKAALSALKQAEEECIRSRFIKTEFSGTTAVICIIRGNHLTVLNVGDSRAILASDINDKQVITPLTRDHKPSLEDEKARILAAGGRVFSMEYEDGYNGPARVWLADQDIPGLAMSRSLCDTVAHSVGVISEPEITERTLTDDDRIIVMGSDGLWEFIPSEEVIQLIEDCEQPEDAVERLSTVAWKRWFDEEKVVDDTTIIVVSLGKQEEE